MSKAYDVQQFEPDYCQADVLNIAAGVKSKASLLAVGMPGCGKSRLVDFLLHRPGVLERYGLADKKFVRVDGDVITEAPRGMYLELLRALGYDVITIGAETEAALKNRLLVEVRSLEANTDLVVIFDNFAGRLQQALGENFFNFLFALRNARLKLNVSYIFMANLDLDLTGFYKVERLFDKGPNRSIVWLSLLNQKDAFFSINRQLYKAGLTPAALNEVQKEKIYRMTGGHALLTRYLTHLTHTAEVSLESEPAQILAQGGLRTACGAIWDDLDQPHKNGLIDLVGLGRMPLDKSATDLLKNYGVLNERDRFFSPLFEAFVKEQRKSKAATGAWCNEAQTNLIIPTPGRDLSFTITALSQRKRRLFCYLSENLDETCSKDKLIEIGWPADGRGGVSDQALSRQIDGLRSWLKQQDQLSRFITLETVWGTGYRLVSKE